MTKIQQCRACIIVCIGIYRILYYVYRRAEMPLAFADHAPPVDNKSARVWRLLYYIVTRRVRRRRVETTMAFDLLLLLLFIK